MLDMATRTGINKKAHLFGTLGWRLEQWKGCLWREPYSLGKSARVYPHEGNHLMRLQPVRSLATSKKLRTWPTTWPQLNNIRRNARRRLKPRA